MSGITESYFDRILHTLHCKHCGRRFEKSLRTLLELDHVPCPVCANKIDVRQSKQLGELADWFEAALRLDEKGQKG